jgi:hypothetical protein
MKLYMFRTVRLSVIGSLFTVYSAMVYAILELYTQQEHMLLLENSLQTCMTYTIAECTGNKLLMIYRRIVRKM